jgi:translation initiation factor IF-3
MTPSVITSARDLIQRLMAQSGAENATDALAYAEAQAPDAARIAATPTPPIGGQVFRWGNS